MSLLEARGISKEFSGTPVLRSVDFEVMPGEVHALIGENGAGKSTLMRILVGAENATGGQLRFRGQVFQPHSPADALRIGIAMIHQELLLFPDLRVSDNIFMGHEPGRFLVDRHAMHVAAVEKLGQLGCQLAPATFVRELSIANQQMVAIAHALSQQCEVLILDEPTSALTPHEIERLLQTLAELRRQGTGIIYISHRLEEIFQLADRLTVLRDGRKMFTRRAGEVDRTQIVEAIAGRPLEQEYPAKVLASSNARVALAVKDLRQGRFGPFSFSVRSGEMVGIAGLAGSGRSRLLHLIYGSLPASGGTVQVEENFYQPRIPSSLGYGLFLLAEDRNRQALFFNLSSAENLQMGSIVLQTGARVRSFELKKGAERAAERFQIRGDLSQPPTHLSGGNRQKVALARWLKAKPHVLLLDEPTRGVDVGARYEIYEILQGQAEKGTAILMASSDLEELCGVCHRVAVLRSGKIVGWSEGVGLTPSTILSLAFGQPT